MNSIGSNTTTTTSTTTTTTTTIIIIIIIIIVVIIIITTNRVDLLQDFNKQAINASVTDANTNTNTLKSIRESLTKLSDIGISYSIAYRSSSSSSSLYTCSNQEIDEAKNILGNTNAETSAVITSNVNSYAVASDDLMTKLASYITVIHIVILNQ